MIGGRRDTSSGGLEFGEGGAVALRVPEFPARLLFFDSSSLSTEEAVTSEAGVRDGWENGVGRGERGEDPGAFPCGEGEYGSDLGCFLAADMGPGGAILIVYGC